MSEDMWERLQEKTQAMAEEQERHGGVGPDFFDRGRVIAGMRYGVAEIMFGLLPLIVLILLQANEGNFLRAFSAPEWSLVAAIFFGQTISRQTEALFLTTRTGANIPIEKFQITISVLIVLGLVPALIAFGFLTVGEEPAAWVVVLQLGLFAFATMVYLFAVASQHVSREYLLEKTRGDGALVNSSPGKEE